MAFYIIDKITNKINPNLITSEVALFETEQDFMVAYQQWFQENIIINKLDAFDQDGVFINIAPENSILQKNLATLPLEYETITKDLEYETIEGIETIKHAPEGYILNEELGVYESINITIKPAPEGYEINEQQDGYIELPNSTNTKYIQTILPNENDYQYRVATEIEKNQHFDDYLKYKIDNATETTIVVTHKDFQNIDNTSRQPMIDYIIAQHNQELFGGVHDYIKATGDLLNKFLTTKELIENEKKSKEILENKKTELYQQITKDMDSQRIQYNFYNSQKPITESQPQQIVAYYGLPILETYNQLQVKISSNDDPVKIETIDLKAVFEVPFGLLKYVDEVISKNNNNKNNTKFALQSALLYNCNTEEEFTNIKDYYKQISVQDGDDVKDGFQTVPIDIAEYNIKIYDLTMGLEVLQNTKTKEETNITNEIFANLI